MSIAIVCGLYFGLNFVVALLLHIHGEHQAHLRLRWADVAVHFLLLTAVGLPLMLGITLAALFGPDRKPAASAGTQRSVPPARAA